MVRISEELVRKRAEHNEGEIGTLEELSLHQQDIEKIEYLDKWCRDLKILYLQNNLIGKIENVSRLKKLEYINLALNNIEKIENLENCESLEKLDLTVNFVGLLSSIESLCNLEHLRALYLTGNPCTNYDGYRHYVIATLPQLQSLDGEDIIRSERILAQQNYQRIKESIKQQEESWLEQRRVEKKQAEERKLKRQQNPNDEENKDFWNEQVPFTPESRWETHEYMEQQKIKDKSTSSSDDTKNQKRERKYFNSEGKPYNINESKIEFTLKEEEEESLYILDVAVYKHLDTALINCDVQTNYVRIMIKDKLLQLALPEEVRPDDSQAQRSQSTGHLVISMPKANGLIKPKPKRSILSNKTTCASVNTNHVESQPIKTNKTISSCTETNGNKAIRPADNHNFIDNPEVPPLE